MVNKDAEGRTGVSVAVPEGRGWNPREYGCGASKPTAVPESQCEIRFWVLRSPSRPDFFRPGGGAHKAVRKAREYVAAGRRWVVDMGMEKFFDHIRRYLQGRALSPVLSNILLDDLDKELECRGHAFCRYAMDKAQIAQHHIWRQWKRPYTRAKNLMRRGLSEEREWKSATTGHGPLWNSGASHMNQAFPLGLVSLQASMLTMNRRGMEPYARWSERGELQGPPYSICDRFRTWRRYGERTEDSFGK